MAVWDTSDGRPYPAQMRYTGAEHAMFAEMLLSGEGRWYKAVADRIAAAGVHAQLATVAIFAQEGIRGDWDLDTVKSEWAHALATRSPAARADDELAALLKDEERG